MRRNLFDIFKEYREFTIEGEVVGMVSLDYQQSQKLAEDMESQRIKIQQEFDGDPRRREPLETGASALVKEEVVDQILMIERPLAASAADLAPKPPKDKDEAEVEEVPELTPAQKEEAEEQAAMARWRQARADELAALDVADLRDLLVKRQLALFVRGRSLQWYIDTSLILMVVDPECVTCREAAEDPDAEPHTRQQHKDLRGKCTVAGCPCERAKCHLEPLLSDDPKSPNYFGQLTPKMLNELKKCREEFFNAIGGTEKEIRKTAEAPPFSASGDSPAETTASPGATTGP